MLLVLSQVQAAKADVSRTITFKTAFGTNVVSDTITIPQDSLNYWQSLTHPSAVTQYSSGQYSIDFSQFVDARSMQNTASGVASYAQFGEEDVADTVLSFVQGTGYVSNSYTVQHTLYPVETLTMGGVCDDLSVLYASIMIALGFHVIFLYYPNTTDLGGSPTSHVEVGVHLTAPPEHTMLGNYTYHTINGLDYYVAETTSTRWLVGDLPPSLKDKVSYHEVAPSPTTTYIVTTATRSQTLTFQAITTSTESVFTTNQISLPAQTMQDYLPIFLLIVVGVWLTGYVIGKNSSRRKNVQMFRTRRFCWYCGAHLTQNVKFCEHCGVIQD
jgi:hypothetical protein